MSRLLRKMRKGKKRSQRNNRIKQNAELEWMDFDDDDDYDYEVEEDEEEDYYEEDEEEEYYEDEIEEDDYEDEEDEEEEYYEDEIEEDDYEDEEDEEEEYYEDEIEEDDYEDEEDEEEDYYEDEIEEDDYEDEEDEEEDYYEDEIEEDDYEDEEDEEEDYDEDAEEDEDYYEEEEDDVAEGVFRKIGYKIAHMTAVDHVIAFTGAAVLILAVVTSALYLNARSNKQQIDAFAEIGVGMEDIGLIGESGLLAVSDAQAARIMVAEMEQQVEEQEQEVVEETNGKTEVTMNLTSIQKDLKIKFINKKTGKLIPNIGFVVEIESPSEGTYTKEDDNKDGIIYLTDIGAGKYKVKITSPASDGEYSISSEQMTITVKDKIEYKKVDVADEVKTEAQVNAAVEDTKVNETVVESANADTVEWVESTKTLVEGTEKSESSYEKVDKSQIADPEKAASLGFRLLAGDNSHSADEVEGGGESGDATPIPTDAPTQAPDPTEEPTPVPEEPTPAATPTVAPTAEATDAPTPVPTATPTVVPTAVPTEVPTSVPTKAPTKSPTSSPTKSPTKAPTKSPTTTPTATPTATPTMTPTATPSATPTATPNAAKTDTKSILKSTSGETLYIKNSDGSFTEAKYADYYTTQEFYRRVTQTTGEYRYTGWQTIEGITYFFDKNGNKVTGEQVIQGAKYNFNSDGSLNSGSGHMGIDVSKWNGNIDWNAVKNSGVSYVIIRCGYRGSTTGALIEDPMFRSNIQGASKAGLKVGIYFFTQAVNEVEAVEEASMVLSLISGYHITYPVFLDVEASNGRADGISASARTAVCKAFCQTIQNSGYKTGIYANKTWLNSYIDAPSLSGYRIWLAQYAAAPSYTKTKYDMWQYSSKGKVSGISTDVDMNISYMGY